MSTFIGNLIGFAIIVWALRKWVVPLVAKMMKTQQEAIRESLEESKSASEKLANADQDHAKALEEAKADSARITEEARNDSVRIAEQLREQAAAEADRVRALGDQQVNLLQQQTIRELRQNLGAESVEKAGEIVRNYVADPAAQSATVDRFLDELDAMSPSPAVFDAGASLNLRASSREALAEVVKKFEQTTEGLDADALRTLADELASVAKVLLDQSIVLKHLADPADDAEPRTKMANKLFGGKVGAPTLELVNTAVAQRWSVEANLVDAIEHVARLALLVGADRAGEGEQVEDQLFRFGRVLDEEPRLTALLSDETTPADRRVALLGKVLGDAVGTANATTSALLTQTVELLRGDRADSAIADLAELAVARRGEIVAHVTAAAELSDAQRTRLTEVLGRIYSHPVAVQLSIDPALLGGLQVAVGDEVIDGAISSRLAAARAGLPD